MKKMSMSNLSHTFVPLWVGAVKQSPGIHGLHAQSQQEAGLLKVVLCTFSLFLKPTYSGFVFSDVDVIDYCANQKSMCILTGTDVHVVCEFYGHTGGDCFNFKELPLFRSHVEQIINQINNIRGKVAMGQAVGKDNQLLPRAYGMMKIFWDNELATFAKIMIRQCPSRHGHNCAATRNLTDPIILYTSANSTKDYTAQVLIDEVFTKWGAAASVTTPYEIHYSPNLKREESLFYIKMVVGIATRIGCATAIYGNKMKPKNILDKDNQVLSGRIVCYLSHYSKKQTPVYNTTEPIPGTLWTRCGCPPGFRETRNCLCVPSSGSLYKPKDSHPKYFTPDVFTTSTQASYNKHKHQNFDNYVNEMFENFQNSILSTGSPGNINTKWEPKQPYSVTSGPRLTTPIRFSMKKPSDILTEWTPARQDTSIEEILGYKPTTRLISPNIIKPPVQKTVDWKKQIKNPAIRIKKEKKIGGHTVKEIEEWTTQQYKREQQTAIARAVSEIPPHCYTGIKCIPRIVMLPVFRVQNAQGPGDYRRFGNTSSVQTTKHDDDFSFDEEDELPQNISLRSKLLKTVHKIRKNENVDFFSKEQKLEPVNRLMAAMERNKSILEPIERNLEPYKSNLEPPEFNLEHSERNLEQSERNLEFVKHILEPNLRSKTILPKSFDDRNEQAKKRAMGLLEQIELTGRKAKLNSREIKQFDEKMRRIYKTLMGTRDQLHDV